MINATRCLVLSATLFLASVASRADVIVSSSLNLTQFQITPAAGSVVILPGVSVSAFAQALDSLGGFDQQFNSAIDAAISASAATALANASGTVSGVDLTGSVTGGITIPDIEAFASAEGQAMLSGMFEITGTTGNVDVTLTAILATSQSLLTAGFGQSATSEVTYTFLIPDIESVPVLFYDNLLTIGPDQSLDQSSNPTQTITLSLPANTPLAFVQFLDDEPSGVNLNPVSPVPEPSSLLFLFSGLGLLAFSRHRRARFPQGSRRSAR